MNRHLHSVRWSPLLAYAIGLLVTDGSLSVDGRHIDLSSVDYEQLENFKFCTGKSLNIGTKRSGSGKYCYRIQFSDVTLYRFLQKIGISPHKSKTIGKIKIPNKFFFDFLRGHLDGDGTVYSYFDPRWKASFMFYLCFVSASEAHVFWIQEKLKNLLGIHGCLTKAKTSSVYQLKYAKHESMVLASKLYYNNDVVCLKRKREKLEAVMKQNSVNARVL
jgi:hypothetical protein